MAIGGMWIRFALVRHHVSYDIITKRVRLMKHEMKKMALELNWLIKFAALVKTIKQLLFKKTVTTSLTTSASDRLGCLALLGVHNKVNSFQSKVNIYMCI